MAAINDADGSTGSILSRLLAEVVRRFGPQNGTSMDGHAASFGIGFVAGLRTMTATRSSGHHGAPHAPQGTRVRQTPIHDE